MEDNQAQKEVEQMRENLKRLLEANWMFDLRNPDDREGLLDGIMETIWMSMTDEKPPGN